MCIRHGVILLVAFLIAAPCSVQADDLNPPAWRGGPLSTLTEWEFITQANPTPPDGAIVPVIGDGGGGGPLATIAGPMFWDPFDGDGAWISTGQPGTVGQIILDIPNWIDEEPLKMIRVQMTVQQFLSDPNDPTSLVTPSVSAITSFDPTGPVTSVKMAESNSLIDPTNNLWLRTEDWELRPQSRLRDHHYRFAFRYTSRPDRCRHDQYP